MVALGGGAFSYERGTPVTLQCTLPTSNTKHCHFHHSTICYATLHSLQSATVLMHLHSLYRDTSCTRSRNLRLRDRFDLGVFLTLYQNFDLIQLLNES